MQSQDQDLLQRVAALEARIGEIESRAQGQRVGTARLALRVVVVGPVAFFAVVASLNIASAFWRLPFALLFVGFWCATLLVWAAVELIFAKRFRFTLGSLLGVVLVLGIAFGSWKSFVLDPFAREQRALQAIVGVKGGVHREPVGPSWLRDIVGDHYFRRVIQFEIVGHEAADEQLVHLKEFPKLRCLFLTGPQFDDDALVHLRALKQYVQVILTKTSVSGAGLDELRQAAPNLELVVQ